MHAIWILGAAGAYLMLLFALAYYVDERSQSGRPLPLRADWIYALSLAVYCTSWTFYGSVGRSAATGIGFLPVYLGPILVFVFGQRFLHKLLQVSKDQHLTSIADLIAARYGKRQALAGLVSLIAIVGIVPYLALQLKAVSSSFLILLHFRAANAPPLGSVPLYADTALHAAILMSLFAILFGTRRVDATEQHHGIMAAIAFESLVKLLAFLAVGLFVTYGLYGGFSDLFTRAAALPALRPLLDIGGGTRAISFWSLTALSAVAIVCLPRQFQVTVVENTDPDHLRRAAWLFPLYLVAINVFVLPLALAGVMEFGSRGVDPDTFVLNLPIAHGRHGLALFAFLGGLSAATGMIIVESVALSTMISNDLVLPILLRGHRLHGKGNESAVGLVKRVRRISIVAVLLLAYVYVRLTGESYALVSIGLVSFAAVAQFAPAILGGLYWSRGNYHGAMAGLLLGFTVWAYTLLLPAFAESGWLSPDFVRAGPWGIAALRPYALFNLTGLDRITHCLIWSLLANVTAYVVGSLRYRAGRNDAAQASQFVGAPAARQGDFPSQVDVSWGELAMLLDRFLGYGRGARILGEQAHALAIPFQLERKASSDLVSHVERLLAGAVGSSLARVVVATTVKDRQISRAGVMSMLSDASQAIETQWELLREAVDHIGQGMAMFDNSFALVVCNRRFLSLLEFPESFGEAGCPIERFVRYNAERGEYGAGAPEEMAAAQLQRLSLRPTYTEERERADGRTLEIAGKPLPNGGYIITCIDITERKQIEISLQQAKQALEREVQVRTRELRASEARFRDFAESASDWLWETDAEHRFTYVSRRLLTQTGLPAEAILGKRRWELVAPEELRTESGKWQRHREDMEQHRPFRQFEYAIRVADGSVRRVSITGKPLFDAEGKFLGYRGTAADITEQRGAPSAAEPSSVPPE